MILGFIVLAIIVGCALFAYVPLTLTVIHRDQVVTTRKRPINEILSDAYAEGRLSFLQYQELLDQVHESMPSLDAPYPLVNDLKKLR